MSTAGTSRLLVEKSPRRPQRLAPPPLSVLAIAAVVSVSFASGTLEVRGWPDGARPLPHGLRLGRADPLPSRRRVRVRRRRARAGRVEDAVRGRRAALHGARRRARACTASRARTRPRRSRRGARSAGAASSSCPTGAGKSHVALLAIDDKRRSTLVVAPTLDLVRQWYDLLGATFGGPIGLVGGGEHDVQPLTVTTYDSAYLHMEHLGARFGLVVFDECHHLPERQLRARGARVPRALPPRAHGDARAHRRPRRGAREPRSGRSSTARTSSSSPATTSPSTTPSECRSSCRPRSAPSTTPSARIYRDFVRSRGIRMSEPSGWGEFIILSSQSDEGRRAMAAYRRQRALAFAPSAKLDYLEHLLHQHRADRAILFTQDNATAYAISRRFLVPVITHQTKVRERSAILAGLAEGTYRAVATSKVLNEGVDVPDANVAVILSGSGSVREHVQRLGRILRKKGDKRAVLYELVTEATTETYTSDRRREHSAYR